MKNLHLKLKLIDRLQNQLDHIIWSSFEEYIKLHKINFNYPESWVVEGEDITFSGKDGCRGCYDPMSLSIPFVWFVDREKSLAQIAEDERNEKLRVEKLKEAAKAKAEKSEKETYLRLKAKYEKS